MAEAVAAGLDGSQDILLPLSQHAQNTLFSIARQAHSMRLKVSPFCHENPNGTHEVRGWVLEVPVTAPATALPINCSLFDGVSLVECHCSEAEVLYLLSHAEETRKKLGEAIHMIMTTSQVPSLLSFVSHSFRCFMHTVSKMYRKKRKSVPHGKDAGQL